MKPYLTIDEVDGVTTDNRLLNDGSFDNKEIESLTTHYSFNYGLHCLIAGLPNVSKVFIASDPCKSPRKKMYDYKVRRIQNRIVRTVIIKAPIKLDRIQLKDRLVKNYFSELNTKMIENRQFSVHDDEYYGSEVVYSVRRMTELDDTITSFLLSNITSNPLFESKCFKLISNYLY